MRVSMKHGFAVAALWLSACDGSAPGVCEVVAGTATEQSADWLVRLNEEWLVSTLETLQTDSGALKQAMATLCQDATETSLKQAQAMWQQWRLTMKRLDMFVVGPLVSERLHASLQFWPTRPNLIEDRLARTPAEGWSVSDLPELGAAATGSTALEYLLFDTEQALLGHEAFATRCQYAALLSEGLSFHAEKLKAVWSSAGGYGTELAQAGRGSAIYACVQPALDEIVNAMASGLKQLYDQKTGVPLGTKSGGILKPEDGESARSGYGLPEIQATLMSVRTAWSGQSENDARPTLKTLITKRQPSVAEWYEGVLVDAELKVARAIAEGPMSQQLRDGKVVALEEMRLALKELYRGFAVEVGNVLGTRLSFSDNDGD